MARQVMLTTTDNPFDPFTDFDRWYMWDLPVYNTCGWIDAVTHVSPAFSDEMNDELIEMGIDELVADGPFGGPNGKWKKVVRDT